MPISPIVRCRAACSPLLVVTALLASCSSPTSAVRVLSTEARTVLKRAPLVYAPPDAPRTAETEQLRAAFEGALTREANTLLRHEPALDIVAGVIAETYDEHSGHPARSVMQWLLWRSGATSQYSQTHMAWAVRGDMQGRLDGEADDFARKLTVDKPMSYGVARIRYGRKMTQAIVLGTAPLVVSTLQKSYAPGAPFTLQARPLDASSGFVLFADTESGDVAQEKMTQRDDGSFFISYTAPSRPGRYFIEIRATRPRKGDAESEVSWGRTLLWLPIYVGVPEPADPDPTMTSPLPGPADPAAWPEWITAQYNAERARRGKAPITSHPALVTLAQDRSRSLVTGVDDSTPDQRVSDRLSALGLASKKHHEHHATFESVSDYVYLRLLHPSARKRMLSPDQLLLGIGIARREKPRHGQTVYEVVEDSIAP